MRFRDVEGGRIPSVKRYGNEKMSDKAKELMEFVNMNVKVQECIFTKNEYAGPKSAQTSINNSARRFSIPVHAVIRGDKVYLERSDM